MGLGDQLGQAKPERALSILLQPMVDSFVADFASFPLSQGDCGSQGQGSAGQKVSVPCTPAGLAGGLGTPSTNKMNATTVTVDVYVAGA